MKKPGTISKRMTAADRRQQILHHAFDLIRDQGFKTVSIRDIAHSAQINEALIYRHFPSKKALLLAVIKEIIDRQPVHRLAPAEDKEDFINQLQEFVEFFLEKTLDDPSLPRIILYAAMENYPLPDEFNFQKKGSFLNWMYRSIDRGKAEWGFNPKVDTLVSLSFFMGGLIYFVLLSAVLKTFPDRASLNFKSNYVGSFLKSLEA